MTNIIIAKITSVHGIKGAVKIMSFASNPADIIKYASKMFDAKNQQYKIKITNQIPSKNNDLFTAQIDGITDRNQAELLRNTELFIQRSDLKKSKKDEFLKRKKAKSFITFFWNHKFIYFSIPVLLVCELVPKVTD